MPKPEMPTEEVVQSARDRKLMMPDVLEQEVPEREEAVLLMEEGAGLQDQLGAKPTSRKEGWGMLGRMHEISERLAEIQFGADLDGMRHGRIVFTSGARAGRKTLDKTKLVQLLIAEGVDIDVVNRCMEGATSFGADYIVNKLEVLGE